jgi:hypothetical protein
MSNRHAVIERERPYAGDHARSVTRKASPPRDLLGWFMANFRDEMPDRLHQHDVWRDRAKRGDPEGYEPVGGSALGSPRDAEPFRSFIEDDPYAVEFSEYEGHKDTRPHYARPMRAALARLAGRGRDDDLYPFMARCLYRTALRDGDWQGACASLGIIEPVRRPYIDAALHRLWSRYTEEPPTRIVRDEDAA